MQRRCQPVPAPLRRSPGHLRSPGGAAHCAGGDRGSAAVAAHATCPVRMRDGGVRLRHARTRRKTGGPERVRPGPPVLDVARESAHPACCMTSAHAGTSSCTIAAVTLSKHSERRMATGSNLRTDLNRVLMCVSPPAPAGEGQHCRRRTEVGRLSLRRLAMAARRRSLPERRRPRRAHSRTRWRLISRYRCTRSMSADAAACDTFPPWSWSSASTYWRSNVSRARRRASG